MTVMATTVRAKITKLEKVDMMSDMSDRFLGAASMASHTAKMAMEQILQNWCFSFSLFNDQRTFLNEHNNTEERLTQTAFLQQVSKHPLRSLRSVVLLPYFPNEG
jgi:hypothetical protein